MSCRDQVPLTIYRGETKKITITCYDEDDELIDLTAATSIELEIKADLDGANPALVALTLADGIALEPQSGDTLGQAIATISSARTLALAAGAYWWDVVTVIGGERDFVVVPSRCTVKGVVNT